jgi:hypothetical protein
MLVALIELGYVITIIPPVGKDKFELKEIEAAPLALTKLLLVEMENVVSVVLVAL